MDTRTRQLDASPAAARRRHRRPRLQAAGPASGIPDGPAQAPRLAPPVIAPIASFGPSHASSGGS